MKEFKEANFQDVIKQFLASRGTVYGGSAGAIIMGKRIDMSDDENEVGWEDVGGFGIIDDYSVACHFKEEDAENFRKWSVDHQSPILCVPEEAGLIITATDMRCVGDKPCCTYGPDGTLTFLYNGERFAFAKK